MEAPSFKEDHISQIPALQMLQNLGYTYLSPDEALRLRGGKTTGVILEDILRKQLREINSLRTSSSKTSVFSDSNIESGIYALQNLPFQDGYISASEYVYNLLTLGKSLEQSIDGDKRSFNLRYIDWEHPENNVFHVTEEFSVMRTGSKDQYRPDIVIFVNGIPLSVIECKRPDMKNPLDQAISQHLRNQQEDGIRSLYVYAQMLLSIATDQAKYATLATPEKFWAEWHEKFTSKEDEAKYIYKVATLRNTPLSQDKKWALFADRFRYVRSYFDALETGDIIPSKQDSVIVSLLEPERFLSLIFGFIVYDNWEKKIARYQQYFSIQKTIQRIKHLEGGKRRWGVIWHTQWSGKSLTMVMLAQAIGSEHNIRNPKIILVTDRTDLDKQISETFYKCGREVNRASTWQSLVLLLESKSDAVVTTLVHKFDAAVRKIKEPLLSHDIFVLIDEGHRTQNGTFNVYMQRVLPNACFIAMTGTPLMKKEKNTAMKFGGIIDAYTVDQAVADGAVVPLLYEGRHSIQSVNENAIDRYFAMISETLSDREKADLKKKFSRANQLNIAEQKIYAIAWDISRHFRDTWQGTPFKGQLVCQNKETAIKYKEVLDEIGIVTSEVVISPPDDREWEDDAFSKSSDRVKRFWDKMMDEHGTPKKYEENIIARYKNGQNPEIIIVVDKLLTGFDVPRNTVLYITRGLKAHTLLQAIARVNRLYPDKDFWYIIDYYGILGELDSALETYSSFDGFDAEDLQGTLANIDTEIATIKQKHSEVWDIFKEIPNKRDLEAFERLLKDQEKRDHFYSKLSIFARTLKVALSSLKFHNDTDPKLVDRYKDDLNTFMKLRQSVAARYSDEVDYGKYEWQIQKLIDTHITSDDVQPITELVNIFDKSKFQAEIEKAIWDTAKADTIASRTARHIEIKMNEDPAFYKKFSEMLKDTIKEYEDQRISETEYLNRVKVIMDQVLNHRDAGIPKELEHDNVWRAIYGLLEGVLTEKWAKRDENTQALLDLTIQFNSIIRDSIVVDWASKNDILGKIKIQLSDIIFDEIRLGMGLDFSFEEIDVFIEQIIWIAKIHFK